MFIKVYSCYAELQGTANEAFSHRCFDASKVGLIAETDAAGFTLFTFEGVAFVTDSYDQSGLVELIMQARMNPGEFLPSRYVGKGEGEEIGSTGSLRWSAKDRT